MFSLNCNEYLLSQGIQTCYGGVTSIHEMALMHIHEVNIMNIHEMILMHIREVIVMNIHEMTLMHIREVIVMNIHEMTLMHIHEMTLMHIHEMALIHIRGYACGDCSIIYYYFTNTFEVICCSVETFASSNVIKIVFRWFLFW